MVIHSLIIKARNRTLAEVGVSTKEERNALGEKTGLPNVEEYHYHEDDDNDKDKG